MPREDLARRAQGDGAAPGVQRQDLVNDRQHGIQVVVDDDHSRALLGHGGDEPVEPVPPGGVDDAGGLVQDQQLRAHGQGHGHRQALALPSRELPRVVPDAPQQPHGAQRLLHAGRDLAAGQAQVLQREGDVVVDGAGDHGGVGVLPHVGDVRGQEADGGVGDLGPGQAQAAGVLRGQAVRHEPAQGAHQGGLPAAGGPDDGGDLPVQVGQVH